MFRVPRPAERLSDGAVAALSGLAFKKRRIAALFKWWAV